VTRPMMWVPACRSRPTPHSLTVFPKIRLYDQRQPNSGGWHRPVLGKARVGGEELWRPRKS